MANVDDYSWVNEMTAVCITVIRLGRRERVFDVLRVDAPSEHLATFAEAEDEQTEEREPIQLWQSGKHLVMVEPNGFAGSIPETLLPMVGDGDAVSVYWNINAQMRVLVVEGGVVAREFDPLMYDDGDEPLPEEDGLGFGDPDWDVRAGALVVLERLTGIVLTEDDVLHVARPTFFTPPAWQRRRK